MAHHALLAEVALTPKPGLVDRHNNGAHDDMNLATFVASARAIAPWFPHFFRRGLGQAERPAAEGLAELRRDGLACEQAMLAATDGVNTHKGSIFAFGLLCAAAGRLFGQARALDRHGLCAEVAAICSGLVETDLGRGTEAVTAGERLFRRHGMTGARGEAASGFLTVHRHALPAFDRAKADKGRESAGLFAAFLELLAFNQDTNLVSRGGPAGLGLCADAGAVAAHPRGDRRQRFPGPLARLGRPADRPPPEPGRQRRSAGRDVVPGAVSRPRRALAPRGWEYSAAFVGRTAGTTGLA